MGNKLAKVLLQIEKASLKVKGEKIDIDKENELLKKIKDRYNKQTSPYYASRLWTDAIIDPLDTRKVISMEKSKRLIILLLQKVIILELYRARLYICYFF